VLTAGKDDALDNFKPPEEDADKMTAELDAIDAEGGTIEDVTAQRQSVFHRLKHLVGVESGQMKEQMLVMNKLEIIR
jgi:hypothetical protein